MGVDAANNRSGKHVLECFCHDRHPHRINSSPPPGTVGLVGDYHQLAPILTVTRLRNFHEPVPGPLGNTQSLRHVFT